MTTVAVISALVTAVYIGYHFGRRAGSTPSTWKKRTRRTALARLAVSLIVLLIARRIRQSFLDERALADAVGVWRLKYIEPLQLLRGSPSSRWVDSLPVLRQQLPFWISRMRTEPSGWCFPHRR